MEAPLIEIRNQQRETWDKFSGGWKKWDDFTMNFLRPMGDAIISALQIKETDRVLDVASGTGEPALSIARLAKKGKVVATDLSAKMLELAQENAARKKLNNVEIKVCDVSEMPFKNGAFDKISCRMGFMFFPDMQLAANEMFRVLKPGGRMATSVWSLPDKNVWVTAIMSNINRNIQLPPAPPNAPSMFRCAAPGLMKDVLQKAGFRNAVQEEVSGVLHYVDFNHYWTMMNEVAAPVVSAMSKADEATKQKIKLQTEAICKQYMNEKGLELPYSSLILSCEK